MDPNTEVDITISSIDLGENEANVSGMTDETDVNYSAVNRDSQGIVIDCHDDDYETVDDCEPEQITSVTR